MNSDQPAGEEMLTLRQAAAELKVSYGVLAAEAAAGRLPHIRVGRQIRIARSRLESYKRGDLDDRGELKAPPPRPRISGQMTAEQREMIRTAEKIIRRSPRPGARRARSTRHPAGKDGAP